MNHVAAAYCSERTHSTLSVLVFKVDSCILVFKVIVCHEKAAI